jgi:ribosome-binding protein aMBF1 (putative translation factor)
MIGIERETDSGEWLEVRGRVRPKRTKQEKEAIRQAKLEEKKVYDEYYKDIRPAPPPPKVPKKLPAKKIEPTEAKPDEEDTVKMKVISYDQRQKLQTLRTQKGLTRKDLAKKVNVVVRVVDDYENGKGSFDHVTYNLMIQTLSKLPDPDQQEN